MEIPSADNGIEKQRKRPLILSILTLLLFTRVVVFAGSSIALLAATFVASDVKSVPPIMAVAWAVALGLYAILLLVAATGMWMLKPWAWWLNMIIIGFQLVVELWVHFTGELPGLEADLTMALNVIIVFYLVQGDVRRLFGDQQPSGAVL
jgi:hypothetical protein